VGIQKQPLLTLVVKCVVSGLSMAHEVHVRTTCTSNSSHSFLPRITAEKPSLYRLEYEPSGRAKCKGWIIYGFARTLFRHHRQNEWRNVLVSCILRYNTRLQTDVQHFFNSVWRHWGCVTPKMITELTEKHHEPDDLDSFDELRPEDQAKIITAYQTGSVADAEIPDSARKPKD